MTRCYQDFSQSPHCAGPLRARPIFISTVIIVLSAQTVLAEQGANKPFRTVNGRTPTAAPAGPRVSAHTIGAGQAPAATSAMGGGGRQVVVSRDSTGRTVRRVGRRIDGTPTEEAPPIYKPGALIRTMGQQRKYEKAGNAGTYTVGAGEIAVNDRKALHVGRAPSMGSTDAPSRTSSGGAAPNFGSGSGGSAGAGGSGGGRDNNGSGNNGRKDGDDYDGKGRDKAFDDPTGFNAAY